MHRKNALNLNVFVALLLLPNVVVSGYGNYYPYGYGYRTSSNRLALITGKCEDMNPTISLDLSGIEFRTIPDNFINSPHVNCLTLRRNSIYTISPRAFRNVSNLFFLDLSANILNHQRVLNLSSIENLKTLVLDGPLPSYYYRPGIPTLTTMPNLKHLYIRYNSLRLNDTMFGSITPNLTHLYLSTNNLRSADLIKNLPQTLTCLYLEYNLIESVLESLPVNLTELNLNGNRIKAICHSNCSVASLSLRGVARLQKLFLSRNQIVEISPNAFDDAGNLLVLDLSHNNITTIKNSTFLSLIKLENISISDNVLTSVPNFYSLSNIKFLNLKNNSIALIDSNALCNISSLNTLILADNRIQSVDDKFFACLASVEVLDLSNNQLRTLSAPQMSSWSALRKIYVTNNLFENFNDLSLINMKNLTDIYIQRNQITYLNSGTIQSFGQNVSVHFLPNSTN